MADNKSGQQEISVDINPEITPIFYTDSISMTANQDGLVLDVMQRIGNTNRARVVSRIGMSRDHAKKFAQELSKLLAITQGQGETREKN
jgi:hypothetical protein